MALLTERLMTMQIAFLYKIAGKSLYISSIYWCIGNYLTIMIRNCLKIIRLNNALFL